MVGGVPRAREYLIHQIALIFAGQMGERKSDLIGPEDWESQHQGQGEWEKEGLRDGDWELRQ